LIADDFAELRFTLGVAVKHTEITQRSAWHGAVLLERLPLHTGKNSIIDGVSLETGVKAVCFYSLVAHNCGRCPFVERFLFIGRDEGTEGYEEKCEVYNVHFDPFYVFMWQIYGKRTILHKCLWKYMDFFS
jgi:hypothetical protein